MQQLIDNLDEIVLEMLALEESKQNDRGKLNRLPDNVYIFERQYLKTLRRLHRYVIRGERQRFLKEVFKENDLTYHNEHQYSSDKGRQKALSDIKEKLIAGGVKNEIEKK